MRATASSGLRDLQTKAQHSHRTRHPAAWAASPGTPPGPAEARQPMGGQLSLVKGARAHSRRRPGNAATQNTRLEGQSSGEQRINHGGANGTRPHRRGRAPSGDLGSRSSLQPERAGISSAGSSTPMAAVARQAQTACSRTRGITQGKALAARDRISSSTGHQAGQWSRLGPCWDTQQAPSAWPMACASTSAQARCPCPSHANCLLAIILRAAFGAQEEAGTQASSRPESRAAQPTSPGQYT